MTANNYSGSVPWKYAALTLIVVIILGSTIGFVSYNHVSRSSAIAVNEQQVAAGDGGTIEYVYEEVGPGGCLDTTENMHVEYSSIGYENGYKGVNITSPDDCKTICSACPGQKQKDLVYRGFEYSSRNDGKYVCFCLVDRPGSVGDFGATLYDACVVNGTASEAFVAPGTGEINRSEGFSSTLQCYKATEKA